MSQRWKRKTCRNNQPVAMDRDEVPDMISVVQELPETTDDEKPNGSGSNSGKRSNIEQEYETVAACLHRQYLCPTPTYDAKIFGRHYSVSGAIYDRIFHVFVARDYYFAQKTNCGKAGILPHVKVTVALRKLEYGLPPDPIYDCLYISETTKRGTVKRFIAAIVAEFGPVYLRLSTEEDIKRIIENSDERGTPGLLGSID